MSTPELSEKDRRLAMKRRASQLKVAQKQIKKSGGASLSEGQPVGPGGEISSSSMSEGATRSRTGSTTKMALSRTLTSLSIYFSCIIRGIFISRNPSGLCEGGLGFDVPEFLNLGSRFLD